MVRSWLTCVMAHNDRYFCYIESFLKLVNYTDRMSKNRVYFINNTNTHSLIMKCDLPKIHLSL